MFARTSGRRREGPKRDSAAAERANYQLFLSELCDFLDVPRPDPSIQDARGAYVFERPVTFRYPSGQTGAGFIDLYKRGCFVLEARQGSPAAAASASAAPPSGTKPCSAPATRPSSTPRPSPPRRAGPPS